MTEPDIETVKRIVYYISRDLHDRCQNSGKIGFPHPYLIDPNIEVSLQSIISTLLVDENLKCTFLLYLSL